MSSNLPFVHLSRRGHKSDINISSQQIFANSKRGLVIERSAMLSEYSTCIFLKMSTSGH